MHYGILKILLYRKYTNKFEDKSNFEDNQAIQLKYIFKSKYIMSIFKYCLIILLSFMLNLQLTICNYFPEFISNINFHPIREENKRVKCKIFIKN